jgi:hypothetical protein
MHRPGGILAQIGEGREDEVVAPLSALASMTGGGPQSVTIHSPIYLDGEVIAENTHTHLLRKQKREGDLGFKAA